MFKWKKEEAKKEVVDPNIVYADKTGLYCDLCGKLIRDDSDKHLSPAEYGITYQRYPTGHYDADTVSVSTVIPRVSLVSIANNRELDLCQECQDKIVDGVLENSHRIMEDLVSIPRFRIFYDAEDRQRERERIRELERDNNTLERALTAASRNYE